MARSRWDTVGALLERVRDVPPEERDTFLDRHGMDDAVREEVRSLLWAEKEAGHFFEGLAPAVPLFVAESEDAAVRSAASSDPLGLVGEDVGRYQIERHLGGGGMGIVYKAHDLELGRSVALKFLPPYLATSVEAEKRFVREARAASSLDHQNIATIYEIGLTQKGSRFIAMAYYEGETLEEVLSRTGALSIETAVEYACQVAAGLARAHEAGIIHRDIKPANALVTERGVVKLLDFGLARVADRSRLTQSGRRLGTVAYMSPEQAKGREVDARTDVWALGVLLYQMVTGTHPFEGDHEMALLQAIQHEEPVPVRERRLDVPERLASLIGKCLEKDPADRPGTVDEMAADLRSVQPARHGEVSSPVEGQEVEGPMRSISVRPLLIGLSGLVVIVLGLWLGSHLLDPSGTWAPFGSDAEAVRFGETMPTPSLVLLPCTDGDASSNEWAFCTGLMATLTDRLVQLQRSLDLWVVPASEVQRRGATTPSEAREWYTANLVVTATVEAEDDGAQIRLRLFEGDGLAEKEAASVRVAAANMTVLQKEAVLRLVKLLGKDLPFDEENQAKGGVGTVVPGAYEAYLRGEGHLWRHEEERHLESAVDAFERSVEEDSTYARAHAGLCTSYWHQYEATQDSTLVDRAERHCNRALAINETLVSAHAGRGVLLRGTNRYDEAVAAFRRAVALAPGRADLYEELAATYGAQGRLDKAEATYNTVVYRWPEYWVGYNALGVFYRDQGQFEAAATQFRQAMNAAPHHFRPVNNLAVLYLRLGHFEKARTMFQRLIELRPNPVAYSNLGTIYFQEGRYGDAARAFQDAIDLNDDDYRLWGNLADALYWSGTREEAESHYRKAARMAEKERNGRTGDPRLLCHLSGYYAKLRQSEKALSLLNGALEQAPNAPHVLFFAATTNAQLGRHEEALNYTDEALQRGMPAEHVEDAVELRSLRADPRFQEMVAEARSAS